MVLSYRYFFSIFLLMDFFNKTFNNSYDTIYAIGDIHGDITALIIALRDCCQVISKKTNLDHSKIDTDMEQLLQLEFDDPNYKDDLNYQWVGNNSAVVLCGDILDNTRGPLFKRPGEYPFEEARILKFINSINKQAMEKNGRIFKVLGNHDMNNLNGTAKYKYSTYVSQFAKDYPGYKIGADNRMDYFCKGKPGAKLLAEDGAWLFLSIRDFIFVHGGISNHLLNVENLVKVNTALDNYMINEDSNILDSDQNSLESSLTYNEKNKNGLVLDRYFGFKKDNESDMCHSLYNKFKKLCQDLNCQAENMKLVIGHCVQNHSTIKENKLYNLTYVSKINETIKNNIKINQEFGGDIQEDLLGGITISCHTITPFNSPSIFRVDVGMSRGFNFDESSKFYESKLPQVLKIVYQDNKPITTIIKSTLENAEIHIPQFNYNPYKEKYIKYKTKYLSLLRKIN